MISDVNATIATEIVFQICLEDRTSMRQNRPDARRIYERKEIVYKVKSCKVFRRIRDLTCD